MHPEQKTSRESCLPHADTHQEVIKVDSHGGEVDSVGNEGVKSVIPRASIRDYVASGVQVAHLVTANRIVDHSAPGKLIYFLESSRKYNIQTRIFCPSSSLANASLPFCLSVFLSLSLSLSRFLSFFLSFFLALALFQFLSLPPFWSISNAISSRHIFWDGDSLMKKWLISKNQGHVGHFST